MRLSFFVLDTEALLRAKTLTMGVVEEAGYSWVCSRKFTGRKSKSRLAPATEILGQALRALMSFRLILVASPGMTPPWRSRAGIGRSRQTFETHCVYNA